MSSRLEKVTFDIIRRSAPPYQFKPTAPFTILLIEDEGSMGEVTKLLLESSGYQVYVANSGDQGLRLVRAINPGLILSDVNLPGMHGFDILRALRESSLTTRIPVVFLSGDSNEEERAQALALGARAFLNKPCPFAELSRVIMECRQQPSDAGVPEQQMALSLSA